MKRTDEQKARYKAAALKARRNFDCPKCGAVIFGNQGGFSTHVRYCGTQDQAMWSKIDKNHPSGCWVYSGATDRRGYGRPGIKTIRYYAHRRSYEIHKGPIPPGMMALHKCNNPPCCNPDHLYLGTDKENARDRVASERHIRGEKMYCAKLTDDTVRDMRKRYATGESFKVLAPAFGVSYSAARAACLGETWTHIK